MRTRKVIRVTKCKTDRNRTARVLHHGQVKFFLTDSPRKFKRIYVRAFFGPVVTESFKYHAPGTTVLS